jgi:hypothetical protein
MPALKPRGAEAAPKKAKAIKIPKGVAACADRLYACKLERAQAQKVVDALADEESAIKEYLIQTLPKGEASGTMGKQAKAYVYLDPIPQVKDWKKFHAYVWKNKAFDMLPRSIAKGAVTERLDAKKKIPGVEVFNVVKVSCTKL